jgi:hypothetical protein
MATMDQRYRIGRMTPSRVGRQLKYLARHALAPAGRLPDVVIVGAMKGGTTSLFSYLAQHPEIHGSIRKEVHYFDRHFKRGNTWYRKHFTRRGDGVVLEATPDYMFHKSSLDRIRTVLPNAKLIIVLRDPVRRAYSHYHHSRTKGTESRTFQQSVRADLKWFRERGVLGDDSWESNDHSYIRRSIYAPQVCRIRDIYGSALLVLRSEDLFANPLSVTNQALGFIGLSSLGELSGVEPETAGRYDRAVPMHRELEEFFLPHNEALYQLLRVDPWWPRSGTAAVSGGAAAA